MPGLAFQETGTGPLLFLLPGLDGTGLLFFPQLPRLAERFRTVAVALPDGPGFTMESMVAELDELISRLAGSEPVLLLGESFGGTLALRYALAHPGRLRGLVLLNTFSHLRRRLGLALLRAIGPLVPVRPARAVHRWARPLLLASP